MFESSGSAAPVWEFRWDPTRLRSQRTQPTVLRDSSTSSQNSGSPLFTEQLYHHGEEKNPSLTPYLILTLVKLLIDQLIHRFLGIPLSFQTRRFAAPLLSVSLPASPAAPTHGCVCLTTFDGKSPLFTSFPIPRDAILAPVASSGAEGVTAPLPGMQPPNLLCSKINSLWHVPLKPPTVTSPD